jgi:GT2 family glycosyltransferase
LFAAIMLLRSSESLLDAPQVFSLGGDVLLVAWDGSGGEPDAIGFTADGDIVDRRRASLRLPVVGGAVRTLLALQISRREQGDLRIRRSATEVVRVNADQAQSDEPSLLCGGLDAAAQSRLVGFVLGVCRATFRMAKVTAFARFCRTLTERVAIEDNVNFIPKAHVLAGYVVYGATPPSAIGIAEGLYATSDSQVFENRFRPIHVEANGGESQIMLAVPVAMTSTGVRSVLVGTRGAISAEFAPARDVPGIASLAEQGAVGPSERGYVLRCLGLLGENPAAAAAARALQILAPERPRELVNPKHAVGASLELSISCGAAGVFVRGWIRDPHCLVQDAELLSPFGHARLSESWRRLPRPDLEKVWGSGADRQAHPGFVSLAAIDEPVPVLQHHLRLLTAGGPIETTPPLKVLSEREARDAVLASVAARDLDEAILANAIAPATAELHKRVMSRQAVPDVVEIGTQLADPAVSLIIPLYRNLSFLRLQANAFAVDAEIGKTAELIFVLDSPEQRVELEHLFRGLHVVTGLPFRLVVMSANFGFAAANNTGVRAARGRLLMLMNSDVIPIGPGWLGKLRAALESGRKRRATAAVGPKLLFDDGSLQHAGLTFDRDIEGRWYNTHFFKGYPRDWPAANTSRSVPGITGAAMLMPRAIYEDVGGFCEDYVVGDYEDSDLCLKLRSRDYDIVYEPRAELYHFERRSIELHAGYVGTAASAYNRRLHAQRWSDLMERLTTSFESADNAIEKAALRLSGAGAI